MKRLLASSAAFVAALAWQGGVQADPIPVCEPPAGVTAVPLRHGPPPALAAALSRQLGKVALPGRAFDATDVVVTGVTRRLIFVWRSGRRWIVATERGGRGYNTPVLAFATRGHGGAVAFVRQRIARPDALCAAARDLLAEPPGRP